MTMLDKSESVKTQEIIKKFPTYKKEIKAIVNIIEINESLVQHCTWCPFEGPCRICDGLEEFLRPSLAEEELEEYYRRYSSL